MRVAFVVCCLLLEGCVGANVSTLGPPEPATAERLSGDAMYEFRTGDPCGPGVEAKHCFLNPRAQHPILLTASQHEWTRLDVTVTWPASASAAQQFFVNVTLDHVPLVEKKVASPFTASFDVSLPYVVSVNVFPDVGDAMVQQSVHAEATFSGPQLR